MFLKSLSSTLTHTALYTYMIFEVRKCTAPSLDHWKTSSKKKIINLPSPPINTCYSQKIKMCCNNVVFFKPCNSVRVWRQGVSFAGCNKGGRESSLGHASTHLGRWGGLFLSHGTVLMQHGIIVSVWPRWRAQGKHVSINIIKPHTFHSCTHAIL